MGGTAGGTGGVGGARDGVGGSEGGSGPPRIEDFFFKLLFFAIPLSLSSVSSVAASEPPFAVRSSPLASAAAVKATSVASDNKTQKARLDDSQDKRENHFVLLLVGKGNRRQTKAGGGNGR